MARHRQDQHECLNYEDTDVVPININSKLVNPFTGLRHEEMDKLIVSFMKKTEIEDTYAELIRKGAFLAQDAEAFEHKRTDGLQLTSGEQRALDQENPKTGNKWNQPWIMYALVGCCSLGAAVQGAKSLRSGDLNDNADMIK